MTNARTTGNFLFVNKTKSSEVLSRSYEQDERFDILSYVQNRRRQKGKRQKPEPWRDYTTCMTSISENKIATSSPGQDRFRHQTNPEDNVKASRESQYCRSPLPCMYPTDNAVDPFRCTVVGQEANIHIMLRFAFYPVAKKTFLAEAFAFPSVDPNKRAMRHSHMMEERLRRCVSDEMLMHATLAYGSSCLAWSIGKYEKDRPPEYFIGKTLQAVRQRLSQPNFGQAPDPWLLLSIYALTITEFWGATPAMWTRCPERYISVQKSDIANGLEAARTHLNALIRLIEAAGGWSNVDMYILQSALLADKYMAIYNATTPVIPFDWDPGPLSKARQMELGFDPGSILPRFGSKLLEIPAHPELHDIIECVVDFAKTAQCAWNCTDLLTTSDEDWLCLRHQALIYRLLLLPPSLGPLDRCVRHTILLFLLNSTEYQGCQQSTGRPLSRLKTALISLRYWEMGQDDNLLFWILATAAMSTQPSPERNWFEAVLADLLGTGACPPQRQGFLTRLESYFFLPEKQESQLSAMIDRLNVVNKPYS
ncbi:hypothetical protein RBB50_009291 [Rhinocladiella similis]